MKIKSKLFLGIGLLFLMIVLLTVLSSLFINKLSGDTKNILVANYNTLAYSRQMLISLNKGIHNSENVETFLYNLNQQQNNVTEVGEKQLTDKLSDDFRKLKIAHADSNLIRIVNRDITDIMLLNMQAIQRKSSIAGNTADNAIFWISIFGTLCFLIAFILLVNLPGNIANPVKQLTASIKEIAAQNYSQRIHFEKNNEFGELASAFNTMAQKLEEYKAGNLEKLLIEKKRVETLINNMNDPVIGLDHKNRILFMNDMALKISGLTGEDIIGKLVQDIAVHNDLIRSLVKELFNPEANKEHGKKDPIKIYADNKESYFEKEIVAIKIIPTGEKEEKLIGNVILLQNITPYKELDFAKTNFIATVSHELKTPISSIKMSTQLLANNEIGEVNDEQKNLIEGIKDDADRLLKITGELLNMTQVESGSIQLSAIPSSPKEILDYAINANKTAAEQKQIRFNLSIPETLPKIIVDSDKTAWVLTNLISNAVRYSYDNSAIKLSILEEEGQLKFTVADTGQGIPPQYVNKIFDRYFRIPGTKKEGTGLGLSISKEFIEAQGGFIIVKSELGAGSSFTISFPVK
jgi:NtrC-family two-component system sensor histidine kinase KinB